MKSEKLILLMMLLTLFVVGCEQQKPSSTPTSGVLRLEVDESIGRVIKIVADSFQATYPKSKILIETLDARVAITNFINDSIGVIVTARELNEEELSVLKKYPDIQWNGYRCAFDAIAVIGNKHNPSRELRISELDSIFQGSLARWNSNGKFIDVVIGGVNSSVNEVFKKKILKDKPYVPAAIKIESSDSLIRYIEKNPDAIGIVGVNWIRGQEENLAVFALGTPGERPDSTEPFGRFYAPLQAHIHRNYYPIVRPVYIYSREYGPTLASGFVGYLNSIHGQQKFLNEGLVPATKPVRLVETKSQQVR